MKKRLISYDRSVKLWAIEDEETGKRTVVPRVIFRATATATDGRLIIDGALHFDGEAAVFKDGRRALGVAKPKDMRDWCLVFDENLGRWAVYRHDSPKVVVMAKTLDIDCEGVTSNGVLHCLAEMLVEGTTNRTEAVVDADRVLLRTLETYDQIVQVPVMAMRSRSKLGR